MGSTWILGHSLFVLLTSDHQPAFHFVLSDGNQQLGARSRGVAQEVVNTFQEMQIHATWSSDRNDPALDRTGAVKVIVLPGSSRDWNMAPGVLGAASSPDSRSVFIFYPDIERALGLRRAREPSILGGGWPLVRWQRAIARVIAHEILHHFLPGRAHDPSGLFMADLSGSSLSTPRLDVTDSTRKALIEILVHVENP